MNNEQIFYIQYRQSDGYLTVMTDQDHYSKLSDADKQNYIQVIVDLQHLAGWGRYWNHCRYINGALNYPDNYPKDQSVQIADLKAQLAKIVNSNNAKEKSNQDLAGKLADANAKISDANKQIALLKKLSSNLQLQVANAAGAANEAKDAAKTASQGGNGNVSK